MRKLREEETVATQPVLRVYTDVVGPLNSCFLGGAKYFVTLFDEYSGYAMVRFISRKSKTAEAVRDTVTQMGNLFSRKLSKLSSLNHHIVK